MKIEIGDKVEIVWYGSLFYIRDKSLLSQYWPVLGEFDGIIVADSMPEIVGKVGIVDKIDECQGKFQYAINGIPEKHAWYDEQQLKLIAKQNITYTEL